MVAHLEHHVFKIAPLFLNKGRIRRDSIKHPPGGNLGDVRDIGGVEEEFHSEHNIAV